MGCAYPHELLADARTLIFDLTRSHMLTVGNMHDILLEISLRYIA
jgi:hypothetical protein